MATYKQKTHGFSHMSFTKLQSILVIYATKSINQA